MSTQLTVPPNKKLTKEVASAVINSVKERGKLYSGDEKGLDLPVKDPITGETTIQNVRIGTVQNWIHRNTLVIGTNKGFGDLFDEAKSDYKKNKKAIEDKELLQQARRNAISMLKMDTTADGGFVGITSRRDPKTGKRIESTRYKQRSIGTDPIKLKIKADQTMKVLERLDPAFKKEADVLNINNNFSFTSIRGKRQEMIEAGKIQKV